MITIIVGSKSEIKTQAVQVACQNLRLKAEIEATPAPSGIHDQPIGMEETVRGAQNRARAAREERPDAWAFGIESGILRSDSGGWVDMAAVALIEPDGREWLFWSEALPLPTADADAAIARGGSVTIGEIISLRTGCAPDDPHMFLTRQAKSRIDYLSEAVEKALRFALGKRLPKKETP